MKINIFWIVVGFTVFYLGFRNFRVIMEAVDKLLHFGLLSYFLTYIIIGLPVFAAVCLINGDINFLRYLGLSSGLLIGLLVGAVCSLPMFLGGIIRLNLINEIHIPDLIAKTLFAGLFEELYFRGFLFGQLFKKTRLGFIPSILFCSLLFASGHLYQSHDPAVLSGIFITTFMGSVLFSWLYAEWDYNLWIAVFLHTFMNLSWYIFALGDNALGNVYSNIFRGLTIALAIILTLLYKKRQGLKLSVNRSTLLRKS